MAKRKAINLSVDEIERQGLESVAKANGMSISGLIRFLLLKVVAKPESFGLLPGKGEGEGDG